MSLVIFSRCLTRWDKDQFTNNWSYLITLGDSYVDRFKHPTDRDLWTEWKTGMWELWEIIFLKTFMAVWRWGPYILTWTNISVRGKTRVSYCNSKQRALYCWEKLAVGKKLEHTPDLLGDLRGLLLRGRSRVFLRQKSSQPYHCHLFIPQSILK